MSLAEVRSRLKSASILEEFDHNFSVSVSGAYEYDAFLRPTTYTIGDTPISTSVVLEAEPFERSMSLLLGVQAGDTDWRRLSPLSNLTTWNNLSQFIKQCMDAGTFDSWAYKMQAEYVKGNIFIQNLTPAFAERFPRFGDPIDLYGVSKTVLFPDTEKAKVVGFRIDHNHFTVDVGELDMVAEPDPDYTIEINGQYYHHHDPVAVWYETKKRKTYHPENDLDRRIKLMHQSFNVLEQHPKRL